MKLAFHLSCRPPTATAQGKRCAIIGGKPLFFKSKAMKSAEAGYEALLLPFRPKTPLAGALRLTVVFVFPWRKSETKANLAKAYLRHDVRPDLDNMEKALIDCLTRLQFFNDDAQVAEKATAKHWGHFPGITITIEEMK
jgi:Holliday junction resolvase RusA-like endonuclease